MARKKVKLAVIQNEQMRRSVLKKRTQGLFKKANELTVLCGVRGCALVYENPNASPEIWPSLEEAVAVLKDYRSVPDMQRFKKPMNQEAFVKEQMDKLESSFEKQLRVNGDLAMDIKIGEWLTGRNIMHELDRASYEDLCLFANYVSASLDMMYLRMGELKKQAAAGEAAGVSLLLAPAFGSGAVHGAALSHQSP